MMSIDLSRRELLGSGLAVATTAALVGAFVAVDPRATWALTTKTVDQETAAGLLAMARVLYPHAMLGDVYYGPRRRRQVRSRLRQDAARRHRQAGRALRGAVPAAERRQPARSREGRRGFGLLRGGAQHHGVDALLQPAGVAAVWL